MEKSKMCYIIARKIKELEKWDDDLIKQIDELNEKLQKETDEEVKETLMYAIAFKQGGQHGIRADRQQPKYINQRNREVLT